MKRIFIAFALLAGAQVGLNAQTNDITTNTPAAPTLSTNTASSDAGKEYGSYELTLGGTGVTSPKTGDTQFGIDVSLSVDPFKKAPNVWVGAAQSLSWEPAFAGETDIFSDYSWHLYKQLWLNTGWSAGVSYDTTSSVIWHTGPEASFEYYIGDSSFLFAGGNFDLPSRGDSGFLWKLGIGLTW
jgi:hypothetical protein